MAAGLAKVGIKGAFEGALRYVGNPELISRTHFARFLVDSGVCADTHSVFRRYLTPGNPGYVPHRWAGLGDALRWITRGRRHRGHRAPRALPLHADRGIRADHRIHRPRRARRWRSMTGSHSEPSAASTPTRRSSSACWPRAAATSIRPTKAAPTWAVARPARQADAGVAGAAAPHPACMMWPPPTRFARPPRGHRLRPGRAGSAAVARWAGMGLAGGAAAR